MNRQQKEVLVELLHSDFAKSNAAFLVGFQGMSVAQMQTLRSKLRDKGGRFKVAKVRLVKRAIEGVKEAGLLIPFLKDQLGVVFASDEPTAIAKVLYDFSKANEQLTLVSGCFESSLLDKEAIARIALLPSREVLLAQVCGAIKAPASNVVAVLNMHLLRLVLVLKQVGEKK